MWQVDVCVERQESRQHLKAEQQKGAGEKPWGVRAMHTRRTEPTGTTERGEIPFQIKKWFST